MRANQKRWLLMTGLILITSIPASKIISEKVFAKFENTPNMNNASSVENTDLRQDEISNAIELALYYQVEFFATNTLVPYPTLSAHSQLLEVAKRYPNSILVYKKLAELEIELGNKELAEKHLLKCVDLSRNSKSTLQELADFYAQEAKFEKQADTLNKMLEVISDQERGEILQEIISLADKHLINKYLGVQFYQEVLKRYPNNLAILEQYIEELIENKNYLKALNVVINYRQTAPKDDYYFLNKQVDILLGIGKWQEAKELYVKAFDPFWPDEVNQKFYYDVLSNNDQLRVYGRELRKNFEKDPNNFDLAIRLIHYQVHNDGYYYNSSTNLIQYALYKLEEARSKNGSGWQPQELNILARLSLQIGQAERASRYIYTLYNQGHLKPNSELRGKLLYQLFELLMDAESQRLPLTKGNLQFYQDIAKIDTNPGVIGGIISLIFSDTKPKKEFIEAENSATKYFNQAAAYRIFQTYKKEYSTSPQLAQMYLDIIEFYIKAENIELADQMLKEFEERYKESSQFAEVALKLADAYVIKGKEEKELAIYQDILNYLGKKTKTGQLFYSPIKHLGIADRGINEYQNDYENENTTTTSKIEPPKLLEPTITKPETKFPEFKLGLKINEPKANQDYYYYSDDRPEFNDYLGKDKTPSYKDILDRYVFKLNKKGETKKIVELFNNEIKKYPKEEKLYEVLLQWLGQTNLIEEQLAVYHKATKEFPSTIWQDRLARWFIRQNRNEDFVKYSKELLSKFDEKQVAEYLNKFINSYNSDDFNSKLYLSLYSYAHNRFPQNKFFTQGLLNYYTYYNQIDKWQALTGKYYFIWPEVRNGYLTHLSKKGELRKYLSDARNKLISSPESNKLLPYKLFRADAAIWLCNYEEAIDAYRELNTLYPGNSVFADELVKLSRSFGQNNAKFLREATTVELKQVALRPGSFENRVRVGELYAETNDYKKAKIEWLKLLDLGKDEQTYLDVATVFWDYYQYDDALKTIENLRLQQKDKTLLAFEMGAILEAKHQTKPAVKEYIKGLTKNNEQYNQVKKRLAILYNKDESLAKEINRAFSDYRRQTKSPENYILGYVEMLEKADQQEQARLLLKEVIKETKSIDFLESARNFFQETNDKDSEIKVLELKLKHSKSFRENIEYRLDLISAYRENNDKQKLTQILQELLTQYPFSYGVIDTVADTYWQVGSTKRSIEVLRQAVNRSRGKYYYEFSRRLAAREIDLNNTSAAQAILEKLFLQDSLNYDVIEELATLYIRTNKNKELEECLKTGLKAIESQYMTPSDLRLEIASFRERMIENFTAIKDYDAAIRQHIEIINRNPDDEDKLEAAINYTERYGGGDELANYYKNLFQQAYKNYRWAVVLARIYQAKGELELAIKYYQAAIDNQPEKAELYSFLAKTYEEKENLPLAIQAMTRAMQLSNYEVHYVEETILLLKENNQQAEALALTAKLPPKPENTRTNQAKSQTSSAFALAEELKQNGKKEAIEKYRQAFQKFYDNPYTSSDIDSYSLNSYVKTIHKEDSLTKILESLWNLRNKLLKEATTTNTYNSGRARELIQIIERVLTESIGNLAKTEATGEELDDLYKNLLKKMDEALEQQNTNNTLFLLENIAISSNLIDITEYKVKSLYNKQGKNSEDLAKLDSLIYFYETQGAYEKALDILQKEFEASKKTNLLPQIAKFSSLLGNREKEIEALKKYYIASVPSSTPAGLPTVEHYFNLIYEDSTNRQKEFLDIIKSPSVYQIYLINFLVSKKETSLARKAISFYKLSDLWKQSRNAELSLKLEDYNLDNSQYFENILRFQNIGQMIKSKPKAEEQLIGDDWFEMAYQYGQWLYKTPNIKQKTSPETFLTALLERRPENPIEQEKLGTWYLEQKEADKALSFLLNAEKMGASSTKLLSNLGSTYFLKGDNDKALEYWSKIFDKDGLENNTLWIETLKNHGLVEKAREELVKRLIKNRTNLNEDEVKSYIRLFTKSFEKEGESTAKQSNMQADFLLKLCKYWPKDTFIPEFLINEGIITLDQVAPFYQLLVEQSGGIEQHNYDYEYRNYAQISKNIKLLEEQLDHNSNFKNKEPVYARFRWQQQYLQILIAQNKDKLATELIKNIEKDLAGRYIRPDWLRLANIELMLRSGNFETAWKELLHFVKIETYPETTTVTAPNLERLEKSLQVLKRSKFSKERHLLSKAYYERFIALEQYNITNLSGLIDSVYQSGNIELGNDLLKLVSNFSEEKNQARVEKELANLPNIKNYSIVARNVITPTPTHEIIYGVSASQIIAELATKYEQYDLAIKHRRIIKKEIDDQTNLLELVRLLAANNQAKEALEELVNFINNKTTYRNARWFAFSLIPDIAANSPELWKITNNVIDKELKLAIEASRLANLGEANLAIKLINKQFNNSEMKFFLATLETKNNNLKGAIKLLNEIPQDYKPYDIHHRESLLRQKIYLYSALGAPKAVWALIEKDYELLYLLGGTTSLPIANNSSNAKKGKLQTLKAIEQEENYKTLLDLIALSANAAEKLGNFDIALKYLKVLKNVSNQDAQESIQARINQLVKQSKLQSKASNSWQINVSLVTK